MTDLKRIDPASVPGVFRRNGLIPTRGASGLIAARHGGRGCSVAGAMVIDVLGRRAYDFLPCRQYEEGMAKTVGLDREYFNNVWRGWNGQDASRDSERAIEGHADGRAAWLACVEAGLVTESTS